MAETTNARAVMAKVFGRLIRNPQFRAFAGPSAVVCLESDSLDEMLETLMYRYPDGATLAIFYPP